ncbi:MAG TPA: hypothetical protein PL085_11695 [Agriterribacter sp.]|uniref:hypothetical protein n=1 Tax=Agriterribacter sp. TaxID=2821509 RepID=UPI002CA626F2|nr:hypothetical protein [Agriterribacter sp.]HRQ17732.1 hypothetical protein [Agriterribacter sp.]
METSELKTTLKINEWQYNYKINKGAPFFIMQDDFNSIGERSFWLMDEKHPTEYSVATWKVTPKNINN